MSAEVDTEIKVIADGAAARSLRYFLWQRPLAKVLWIACALFWSGAGLSLFVKALAPVFDNAAAGLLFSILFPPLALLYLLIGWLRQEIDAGRIVLGPVPPPARRSIGGWSDPMADPMDPRSPNHTRYIEGLHDRD